jgi:hypothetical protein
MDWSTWWVGSRTQWNVSKDFYMGVDILYQKMESAVNSVSATLGPLVFGATRPADDQDNLSIRFRVHRDFYP